ncbi:sporulation protein YyaC [Lacrimispora sphenoides]|uniref:Uncharacterized protein n=1 Tax=Lacrimispora sphenoides JCM 1415 TaxID=1297793 RepID=A0ABY1CAV1_9FIRM|nr:hypothetical protein SAMN02745906_2609 [[Clostridium] sphenoides JCM 1415]SUY51957.1 sporulation protein YyaC [Lacrimispora sphenoides]
MLIQGGALVYSGPAFLLPLDMIRMEQENGKVAGVLFLCIGTDTALRKTALDRSLATI